MMSHTSQRLFRKPQHLLLASFALLVLCAAGARAQDNDDDGVLPGMPKPGSGSSSSGSSGESASGTLGISGPQGSDLLDPREARLVFSSLSGPLLVDDQAEAQAAAFLGSEPYDFAVGADFAAVQGSGSLVLQSGLDVELVVADDAVATGAFLVVHAAGTSLASVLSGQEPLLLVAGIGDLPKLDLAQAQAAVTRHADALVGLEVSVIQASVDTLGQLHLAAVRFDPAGTSIEVAID